jgi:1-acyl-sn-glycerol-3-phosphate acyltransferase
MHKLPKTFPSMTHSEFNRESTNPPPSLTPATIQRAQEGLAAARDRKARRSVQQALAEDPAPVIISSHQRRFVLRTLIHILFRVKVEFPERIPTTPVMLVANHLSHIDPFILLSEIPGHPRYHVLGDARTLFNQGWKRLFLRLAGGVIPLDRLWKEELAVIEAAKTGRDDLVDLAVAIAQDVRDGSKILALRQIDRIVQSIFARGDGTILFPEGRLGTTEGHLHLPLKRGVAIYALRAGVPIVPVAIIGTKNLYLRKELTLRFGEPLNFPQSHRPKPQEVQAVLDALQAALIDLLPKDYREPDQLKLCQNFLNRMLW